MLNLIQRFALLLIIYKNSVQCFFLLSAADAFIYLWDLRDARRPKAALQAVAGASKVDKMLQLIQGCGTVMICCGSGSDFGIVLVPVPFRFCIRTIFSTVFQQPKNVYKILVRISIIFQKIGLIFDFSTFFHFYIASASKSGTGSGIETIVHSGPGYEGKKLQFLRFRFRFHNNKS
jgi:hypothetical protein